MKLHLAQNAGMLTFSSHGPGYVSVNGTRYEESVMVCGRTVEKNWAPDGFEGLTERQFEHLASLGAEIVLFGSGERQRFPRPELLKALIAKGIGLEVMDTKAACRTYNILVAEGRQVACGVLIEAAA
ncbi:MAG: Mth938-like domain-containing protein [Fluviibacter sp.]|jgi:uncharacterized protein